MRRRLAFVLAGAFAMAACGGGATPTPAPSPSVTPAPTDIYAQSPSPSEAASTAPEGSAAPSAPVGGKTYTIKKGDTLWALSLKFGVTLDALQAANPTVDPTKMRIGSVLVIPAK